MVKLCVLFALTLCLTLSPSQLSSAGQQKDYQKEQRQEQEREREKQDRAREQERCIENRCEAEYTQCASNLKKGDYDFCKDTRKACIKRCLER